MSDSTLPHWHILGAGSMGSLWAARLAQAGHRVTLLLRNEAALQRFQGNGSRVLLMDGDDQQRVKLDACIAGQTDATIERLIVATKAHQAESAVQSIAAHLAKEADVLLLQNGMGIQQRLNDQLPEQRVWIGVSTEGAFCPEYFTVVHAGHGTTRIGSLNPQANVETLLHALQCSLIVEQETDIETALWQKLLVNCAINPLSALYRCRNGELLKVAERREHLHAVCAELALLTHTMGRCDLADGLVERAEHVASITAKNRSSMLVDVEEKRSTEIDFITGYVCELATRYGMDLPVNAALLQQIKAISGDHPNHHGS
jgi:2-dehydropantoate 2-reductase